MVNFSRLAAEIVSLVWSTPANFNGFCVFAALQHGTLVVGVSQTAAFNRRRHLYSAGRPSRWALAHISSWLSNTHEDRDRESESSLQLPVHTPASRTMLVKAVKRTVIVVCLCDSLKYCVSLQSDSQEGNKDQCRPDSPETCAQK